MLQRYKYPCGDGLKGHYAFSGNSLNFSDEQSYSLKGLLRLAIECKHKFLLNIIGGQQYSVMFRVCNTIEIITRSPGYGAPFLNAVTSKSIDNMEKNRLYFGLSNYSCFLWLCRDGEESLFVALKSL